MLFQDVKVDVFVDHDSEEIRDIQKSVEIMLNRHTKLLENLDIFYYSHSTMWKYGKTH